MYVIFGAKGFTSVSNFSLKIFARILLNKFTFIIGDRDLVLRLKPTIFLGIGLLFYALFFKYFGQVWPISINNSCWNFDYCFNFINQI